MQHVDKFCTDLKSWAMLGDASPCDAAIISPNSFVEFQLFLVLYSKFAGKRPMFDGQNHFFHSFALSSQFW